MINKFLKWYNEKFRKMQIIVLIVTVSIIIAGIGSVSSGIKEIVKFSSIIRSVAFVDKYETEYNKISQLNTDLSCSFVDSIFGTPKVRRDDNTKFKHFESFYDCKGYLLYTISNADNKILLYSITITDPQFYAPIPLYIGNADPKNEIKNLRLGKMKLHEISDSPIKIYSGCSSKYGFYSEVYYFGNPGFYKYYLFGYSQLGCDLNDDKYNELFIIGADSILKGTENLVDNKEIIELRKDYRPNSFGVVAEEYYDDNAFYIIGFDYLDGRYLIDNN